MGGKASKQRAPPAAAATAPATVVDKASTTPVLEAIPPFTLAETTAMHTHFSTWRSSLSPADPMKLAHADLKRALGMTSSNRVFLERILVLMDVNKDSLLTFQEFAEGMAALGPMLTETKFTFTFKLFAYPSTKSISASALKGLLGAVLEDHGVSVEDAQLATIVANTITAYDTDKDGALSYSEYKAMCVACPAYLRALTIDASRTLTGGGLGDT